MYKKKLFFCITIVVLALSKTTAQSNKRLSLGISGGAGFATLRGSELARRFFIRTPGYMGALSVEYRYRRGFSIVSGLGWERKGAEHSFIFDDPAFFTSGVPFTGLSQINDYLVLPCLFRVTFKKKNPLFVNAGPYFGYLVKGQIKLWNKTLVPNSEIVKWDMGITAGAGLKIPVSPKYYFSLETRFNFGAISLNNIHTEIKNYSGNLILGFAYNFDARNQGK